MKTTIYTLVSLIVMLASTGCTKDFDEINTNPNAPESVDPQFLLSNIIYNGANNQAKDAWNAGNFLGQLTARFDFNEIDRWDIRTNTEYWNATYHLLNDTKLLIEEGGARNPTYKGMGLVLRSYLTASLTDLWGDVPYSQSLGSSNDNFTPIYDTQEAIYTGENGILATLREAVAVLEASQNELTVSGDVMYNGNVDSWIRFANSLRIRYLLRVSSKVDVTTELQAIVTEGRFILSNQENALVPYLASAPNQWFVHNIREGDYANVRMSTTVDSVLSLYGDPRKEHWFNPTVASQDSSTQQYAGIPNGVGPESRSNFDLSKVSTLGPIFRDEPDGVNALLIQACEVQFALAEAAQRGLIGGSAQAYYEEGIQLSFGYYGLTMPSDYLTRPDIAYDGSNSLEKIIAQKWLGSMLNGYEGWLNYRRTGFPKLKIAVDNTNNDQFPVRYRYPDSEKAVNSTNYSDASSRIGGDTHNSKAWWEI